MKNQGMVCLLAGMLFSFAAFAAEYKPNEIIVKFKDSSFRAEPQMDLVYQQMGVDGVRFFEDGLYEFEQWELDGTKSVEEVVRELSQNPAVEYAQPNYIITLPKDEIVQMNNPPDIPCIPGFIEPPLCNPNAKLPCLFPGFPPNCKGGGGIGRPGKPVKRPAVANRPAEVKPPVADPQESKLWGLTKIQAQKAWKDNNYVGAEDFVVAVIDTGIDYNHEDLAFNIWRNPIPTKGDTIGWDFFHDDALPFDDQGHGTHVSGTIGATGGNGKGIVGVNQRVSIMGLKFLSASGQGATTGAMKAMQYAAKNGAKVLNNSWGGRGFFGNKALKDAVDETTKAGLLFVAASGNESRNNDRAGQASFPAAFPNDNILAVAATDKNDKLALFSNYGKTTTDLAAPGVNIYSSKPGDKYAQHTGTSMAAPHVSGAAALVWSKNPTWDYKKVKEHLMCTVDSIQALSGKMVTGGRLNVARALSTTNCP